MVIYAIIVNYKKKDITIACVQSLKQCQLLSDMRLHIVVVDNDSGDGIERAIRTKFSDVDFLQTGANIGYTGGNNAGIRYILDKTADVQQEIVPQNTQEKKYFFIINNDTRFSKNCLIELARAAARHQKAGIIAPKIYFEYDTIPDKIYNEKGEPYTLKEKEEVIWFAGGIFDWKNILGSHRGVDQVDHEQWNKEEQIDYATGCAMFVQYDVMKKIGGFDNKYFMYYEDVDFNMRVKKLKYEIWYAPKAIMWHRNATSSGVGSPLQIYFSTRNRLLFAFKYASLRAKIAILKEAMQYRNNPTKWQAVVDFILLRFEKGSFEIK